MHFRALICALAVALIPSQARADAPAESTFQVSPAIDGAITVTGFAGSLLFQLLPVDTKKRRESELFRIDERVKRNFSSTAAARSDLFLVTTMLTPVAVQLGTGVNGVMAERTLLYGEAVGVSLLLNNAVKYTVQRARPYNYWENERVRRYAEAQGNDSRLSFYSGHASTAFTSAVAGSLIFAGSSDNTLARSILWGTEITMATLTAHLRVRAGKHFYSDILTGAIIGSSIGVIVPYLHLNESATLTLEPEEWATIGGSFVLANLAGIFMPVTQDILEPLEELTGKEARLQLAPMSLPGGAGAMLSGTF